MLFRSWENEALLAIKELGLGKVEIVVPSISILAEPPVTVVDKVARKHKTEAVAKAYLEYLYSDEGQNLWASGFCYPIRFESMVAANKIPADLLEKLPSTEGAYFPTIAEIEAAKAIISEGWPTVVGVEVKELP